MPSLSVSGEGMPLLTGCSVPQVVMRNERSLLNPQTTSFRVSAIPGQHSLAPTALSPGSGQCQGTSRIARWRS